MLDHCSCSNFQTLPAHFVAHELDASACGSPCSNYPSLTVHFAATHAMISPIASPEKVNHSRPTRSSAITVPEVPCWRALGHPQVPQAYRGTRRRISTHLEVTYRFPDTLQSRWQPMEIPIAGSQPMPIPVGGRRSVRWAQRILIVAVVTLGSLTAMLIAVASFGAHTGEEFCPDSFKRRSFVYYQVPVVRFQISPVSRTDRTNPLEIYLSNSGLIPPGMRGSPRWDLVTSISGSRRWTGEASILCNYLDQQDDKDNYVWLNWSKENPQLARSLWPKIAEVARRQLYLLIPDLMQLADTAEDAERLSVQASSQLADAYFWLAQTHEQLRNHEDAIHFYTWAIAQRTDWIDALGGRARCCQAMGKHEQAAEDRDQIKRLSN